MDLQQDSETIDDLSALAWVHDELRRSVEAAHKAMRRYLKECEAVAGSDVDAVDPAVLRTARTQLHQGVGALELVGLPTAAQVLRAGESALAKLGGRAGKLDAPAVETIERASFALLDYLGRLLASKPVSPLAMFPQYRAVQELAGADRVHPADLWPHDWEWRDVASDGSAARRPDAEFRSEVEASTLTLMRSGDADAARALSDLFAGLAAGALPEARHLSTLWRLAAAFFEAQAQRLLVPDVYSKRIASRLLAQLRMSEQDGPAAAGEVSQRLAQDLLFFCAQSASPGDGRRAPRLAAVRQAWNLARRAPVDYLAASLGRHDPTSIAQARKRVTAAKDGWAAVAGGELRRSASLGEQFHLVGDSLRKLYPSGDTLAVVLEAAAAAVAASGAEPAPTLGMEVATALLYLDASLEDGEFDHPQQAGRLQRLAQRMQIALGGATPPALDAWMEELYRRVSDRHTMGSVVQELKTSLGEAEKAIDLFFRQPARRDLLHPVPGWLNAMRGVFSVLGLDAASQAVVRMRDDVDALAAGSGDASAPAETERLASNLGALGFLIDMLNVQPALVKSVFAFDPQQGLLRAVAAAGSHRASGFGALDESAARPGPVEPRLIEQAQSLAYAAAQPEVPLEAVRGELDRLSQEALVADQPELAHTMHQVQSAFEVARSDDELSAVREELAQAMADFVHSTSEPMALDMPAPRPLPVLPSTPTPEGQTGLEEDDEMRGVFLEEAREVIAGAESALAALLHAPEDLGEMTTVRRAFHTLKGSSRMVGLKEFGEAAWACEQTYNAKLAEQQPADPGLLALSTEILAYLADWVEAIAVRRDGGHASSDVRAALEAYQRDGEAPPLALPGTPLPLRRELAQGAAETAGFVPEDAQAGLALPVVSSPIPLIDLPADLPSAQDLELVPAASAVRPLDEVLAAEEEVSFELDLGEAARMPAGERDALQALALPDAAPGAPAPDAVSSMMSLDLAAPEPPPIPAGEATPLPAESVRGPLSLELPGAGVDDAPPPPQVEDLEPQPLPEPEPESFRMIGPLRVSIPLFNIYLSEADEQSRRLGTELAEWAHEADRPVADSTIALAHSLAGNSATVGFADLSHLARLLEHALMRSQSLGAGHADELALFNETADEIRRLLHQFAAGLLRSPSPELVQRLVDHERWTAERLEAQVAQPEEPEAVPEPEPVPAPTVAAPGALQETVHSLLTSLGRAEYHELSALAPLEAARAAAHGGPVAATDDDIEAVDAVDAELFPIFQEEALELLPQLASRMRAWASHASDAAGAAACMRTLHTLKGGARLAGAMRLGEMAHRLESLIDRLAARGEATADEVEALFPRVDALGATFDALLAGPAPAEPAAPEPAPAEAAPHAGDGPAAARPAELPTAVPAPQAAPAEAALAPQPGPAVEPTGTSIDWQRFVAMPAVPAAGPAERAGAGAGASGTVRVRSALLDRLVNHAGEVSIARSRIESEVGQIRGSLADLGENLERLRSQLRDLELQAETQIASRMEAAKSHGETFDPLEMDRFTRFQELTRMMAESVNDVATVQRTLQRTLQGTEDDLAAQARLTRDLQDDLLRTRMVEFESLSERLYRVARQAAKELQKQVRLDIAGGTIEVDRGVLERMGGAFEHLVRNSVTHGIEAPEVRSARGKDASGQITVAVAQEGNEVTVEFRDDGGGLDLARIRERGIAMGLLAAEAAAGDADLANLIFAPGFTTADTVTELAGRGIGMDVVKNEVVALGGRIETASAPGQGTSFRLVLPLTTAVTQVVLLRAGSVTVAVPATLVEIVRRVGVDEVEASYARAAFDFGERPIPFFWLGALLQGGGRSSEAAGRALPVVVIKSAQQRIAVHVDEVIGNQEVVVKNLGAQLARLPGLAGVTLLASGVPALIYNPVALATLYGDQARAAMRSAPQGALAQALPQTAPQQAPLVMVVDDSLTVRRVTQRLLQREGYRVVVAKDGLDALERLAEEVPVVVLSDIEMPRMDGFDLVRNLRADARLAGLPVIMITSRIAQKHRDHAAELGVNHYLGKPYAEEELLALVARHVSSVSA
ncbi:MAG TPA: Hpt domain-containing protein [Burkholderiaceae bacterium]|nr:Hpt domain-containing protein [Burkholderiaceae bacterium]